MAAAEMYDYLPGTRSATYTTALSTPCPHNVITEKICSIVDQIQADDGTIQVIEISEYPWFIVTIEWEYLSASDAGTIYDYYANPLKANKKATSFRWTHPTDGHTYVAYFEDDLQRDIFMGNLHSVKRITLRIVDRV